jgi:hypothetical protein
MMLRSSASSVSPTVTGNEKHRASARSLRPAVRPEPLARDLARARVSVMVRRLTRCNRKRAGSRSRQMLGSGSQIAGTRSRQESSASTLASILSVLHAGAPVL